MFQTVREEEEEWPCPGCGGRRRQFKGKAKALGKGGSRARAPPFPGAVRGCVGKSGAEVAGTPRRRSGLR